MSNEAEIKEILSGEINVPCVKKDGTKVNIKVRELSFIDEAESLAMVWGKPGDEIELYTGLTSQEIRELSNKSQTELWQKGRDINFFTYETYMREQEERVFQSKNREEIIKAITAQIVQDQKKALKK